jgi:hypothetical protein
LTNEFRKVVGGLTREGTAITTSVHSALVAGTIVKKVALVVGLRAVGEGVVGSSRLTAVAAVGAEEQSVASSSLLNDYR